MNRRLHALLVTLIATLLLCISAPLWAADGADKTAATAPAATNVFTYDTVVAKAKKLSASAFEAQPQVPKALQKIDAATMARITYKSEYALWQGDHMPFEVQFYQPGSFFIHAVGINVVTADGVNKIEYSPQQFDFPSPKLRDKMPPHLGYAGFKLLHHLNSPDYLDEVASFLGASYFRALPKGAHYGLSARGLAINTASGGGEEFPAFTQLWLQQPQAGDAAFTVYALLDSPSVTGAYRFKINPGETTAMQVKVTLFTRAAVDKLGIAPLTSMFMWGENSLHRLDNPRPEAHDSDGLLIQDGNGEWLWRPLHNPQALTLNEMQVDNMRGFGLLQRDRDFSHYQQLDFEYEKRPNLWIVPDSDWGKGRVELVQIPSDSEVNDNMVAYWVPKKPVKAGEQLNFAYTMRWTMTDPEAQQRGTTHATRIGYAAVDKPEDLHKQMKVEIEFAGGKLAQLADAGAVQAHVSAMQDVDLEQVKAVRNPHTQGWRLSFRVATSALSKPLELRAFLSDKQGQPLTETWTYTLTK